MNSTITLGQGSRVTLASTARLGCTDVLIYDDGGASPWTNGIETWSLPVGGETLLARLLSKISGSCDATITMGGRKARPAAQESSTDRGAWSGVRLAPGAIRGSAGCLKDISATCSGGTILVIEGAVWLEDDLAWMLRQHRASNNALTVFCTSRPMTLRGDALSTIEPVSVYCCEPNVVDHVSATGVQDLAAHLIPALQRAGRRVGVVSLRGGTREVCDWPSYLDVVAQALKQEQPDHEGEYEMMAPGVWRHRDAMVSPQARLVGPVLIDRDCRIDAGAVVVGPTILGPGCLVEACARIVRTVAMGQVRFPIRPVVSDRLVTSDASIADLSETPTGKVETVGRSAPALAAVETPSRGAAWFGLLILAGVLVWALSGNAGNMLQAWTRTAFLSAG